MKTIGLAFLLLVTACSEPARTARRQSPDPHIAGDSTPLYKFESNLADDSFLTVYYQYQQWHALAQRMANTLRVTHQRFAPMFGSPEGLAMTLVLVDKEIFHEKTEAPDWINAVFHKGRVFVPLDRHEPPSYEQLISALRHEYMHALVYTASDGRCPAWIDEGLARWAEGQEHPLDRHILAEWLLVRRPIPLSELRDGFVLLGREHAKLAYAQSLFAVRHLLQIAGPESFAAYFRRLKRNEPLDQAFSSSFGITEDTFERRLENHLRRQSRRTRRYS